MVIRLSARVEEYDEAEVSGISSIRESHCGCVKLKYLWRAITSTSPLQKGMLIADRCMIMRAVHVNLDSYKARY